jgi:hypothetical protein
MPGTVGSNPTTVDWGTVLAPDSSLFPSIHADRSPSQPDRLAGEGVRAGRVVDDRALAPRFAEDLGAGTNLLDWTSREDVHHRCITGTAFGGLSRHQWPKAKQHG